MYCINCGKEIINNYKFCINCGQEVNQDNSKKEINNINNDNVKEKIEETKIEYIKDEPMQSIMDNNVIVPVIFGILLATILSIVCIASFNEQSEKVLKYNTCKIEKIR